MKSKKILLGLLLVLVLPVVALGADYLPKEGQSSENIVVTGEHKNLYVAGTNIIVNSPILGDLFGAGSTINITAPVEADLTIAGGTVTINAPVSGDVRVLSGTVTINAPISGDLLVASGTLSLGSEAAVGGDAWISGGDINITGPINGNLKIAGERVYLGSEVLGTSLIKSTKALTFGQGAKFANTINYHGDTDPVIEDGATVGTIDREVIKRDFSKTFNTGPQILETLIFLITLLLMWRFMHAQTSRLITNTTEKFGRKVLWGFLGLIVIPILSLLAIFTVLGFAVGVLAFFVYAVLVLLAMVLSIGVLGMYTEKLLRQDSGFSHRTIFWGALASVALSMVPIVGPIIQTAVFLATFGSILITCKAKINK